MRNGIVLLVCLVAASLAAQRKVITLETIYDPATRVYFSGTVQGDFEWIDDNRFIWPAKNERDEVIGWRLFDVAAGKAQALLKGSELTEDEDLVVDAKKNVILLEKAGDLYLYSLSRGTLTRLTKTSAEEEAGSISPDEQRVAFVRNNDLYVIDLATKREQPLTTTGSRQLINGRMDWVYEEEIYGRGNIHAHWWSPDSLRIVFLQLDESRVPEHTIVDHIPYRVGVEVYDYPKAGDPNPVAKLFVARATGGPIVPIDLKKYSDHLIVNVGWANTGSVTYQVQNRQQTWLDLNTADPSTGASKTVFRDATKAWIDMIANPTFLSDGSFLWQSERSGWRHVYHYRADGTLIRQVTTGEWEVRDLHGVDEKTGYAYFSGTERSVRDLDVYRVRLDGSGFQRLSPVAGTHTAKFNPSATAYVDTWSDLYTPKQTRVHLADGGVAALVEENRIAALSEYDLPRPEFLQVRTRDGFSMEALMIRPPGFDASRKYPVYQFLYGGPHAQQVVNRWRDEMMLFNQLLARHGVIVWMCDNRTASGKGAVSTWPLYKEFGASELRDVEDGIAWLKRQPYVDGSRIMLNGWSYGGFMVSYALTHSKSFVAGIAGGPVTDWRDYDTIYTERFLLTPAENSEGYRRSSPRWFAKDLHGNLLLIHGAVDDNVHVQNTIQFAYELQKAGKQFQLMLYPKSKHSIRDKALDYHRQRLVLDFVLENLVPPASSRP